MKWLQSESAEVLTLGYGPKVVLWDKVNVISLTREFQSRGSPTHEGHAMIIPCCFMILMFLSY